MPLVVGNSRLFGSRFTLIFKALAKALKTLLRRVPTRDRPSILDEVRTVESFAATDGKILVPVFKPALEPWLELALVFDRSSSMDIWHQTLADLKTVLQHYGIFRDVRAWQLAPKENNLVFYEGLSKTNSRVYHPKEWLFVTLYAKSTDKMPR